MWAILIVGEQVLQLRGSQFKRIVYVKAESSQCDLQVILQVVYIS